MLKNNDFGHDTDDLRSERADLMSENIDAKAADLGLVAPNPLLLWGQNVGPNWADARSTAATENGQIDEAYQEYHLKFTECREKYVMYKELLLAIIYDIQANDEIIEEYGIKGRTARSREDLNSGIADWRKTHDRLTALGDPRGVPEAYVAELETLSGEYDALWHQSIVETDESRRATEAKQELFAEDTDKFRLLYRMAVIAYGEDGSELRLLGFVPASEIWTPGMPEEPPEPEPEPEPEPGPEPTIPWPGPAIISAVYVGVNTWDLVVDEMCIDMTNGKWELKMGAEGLWQSVIDSISIEDGHVINTRLFDMVAGDYTARFTPRNGADELGTPSEVSFTVVAE